MDDGRHGAGGIRMPLLASIGALVIVTIAALAVGPRLYRSLVASPAAIAPGDELRALSAQASMAADSIVGTWTISDGSYAGYRVDEVLSGATGTVTGRTDDLAGDVTVATDGTATGTITVDLTTLASGDTARDSYVRNQILATKQYPTATFTLTSPVANATGVSSGQQLAFDAAGTLSLHGVTKEVDVQLTAASEGDTVKVAVSIPITFTDYGVTAPDLGFVSVEPHGSIEALLVLEQR